MRKHLADYGSLFLVAGLIILLDQLTKYIIRSNLAIGEIYRPELWINQFARIVHWQNTGAAFGMFQSLGNVFMILSMVVSAAIIYYYPQVPRQDWLVRLAMAMLLGGALGNLIDRLTLGYVVDFISVGKFPVFNVADACISMGVVVLFIGMWLQEKEKKASQTHPESGDDQVEENKSEFSMLQTTPLPTTQLPTTQLPTPLPATPPEEAGGE